MTPFKLISSIIITSLLVSYFLLPKPNLEPVDPTQLPWNISFDEQKNSRILGVTMNQSTLFDAIQLFDEPESMALYADANKPSIEVYFGYIEKAGLTAKIILTLNVTTDQAEEFLKNATSRMQSNSDIPKIEIGAKDRSKVLNMTLSSLTYLPKYSGLDKAYLIDRFGTPDYQHTLNETAEQLFYKTLGLSLIIDNDGKEVFQYTSPSLLIIPEQAVPYEQ